MSRNAAHFYDSFAAFYPVLNVFQRRPKLKLLNRVNREPRGRLLEVGVGRGEHLRDYSHNEITGIDVSQGMLAYALKAAPPHCTLKVMSADQLEFPDSSFDYAVLAHVLSVVDNPEAVMDEVHRVVVPGGRVFLLNHVSRGNNHLTRLLEPLTKKLHFSATFALENVVDTAKFAVVEHAPYRRIPAISAMVLTRR